MAFNPMQFGSGAGSFLGGFLGDSGRPYADAQHEYQKMIDQGKDITRPYRAAGEWAIPGMEDWLNQRKDPMAFINKLMGGYEESPYARYQRGQMERSAKNAASASGLMGSTPLMKFMEQQAGGIASGDMQNWLKNVLGVGEEYGQGAMGLIGTGQESANSLLGMLKDMAPYMGEAAYNKRVGKKNDMFNKVGGAFDMLGSFF